MHVLQRMMQTEPAMQAGPSPETETILLVEDEEPIQYVIREILERRGYHVLVASDGAQALMVSGAFKDRIDLVLTDVVMPRMNGLDMAKCMALQRPSVKILYMSGYTETILSERERTAPGRYFLRKPFVAHSLARKVREVLDDRGMAKSACEVT
jgi:CheY-like chemotaxis protein